MSQTQDLWMAVSELKGRVEALEGAAEDRAIEREDGEYQRRQIRELYEWAAVAWSSRVSGNRVAGKMRELWPWLAATDGG